MIRLAVISGKGGTGKTVITAALAHLLPRSLVLADCDVDAANLPILLAPKLIRREPFFGMKAAVIDPSLCTRCGQCQEHCRFHAVAANGGDYTVNPLRCEGCGVCVHVCPAGAIRMGPRICGEICLSKAAVGNLAHGKLRPGAGNSGLLVHAVKKTALEEDRGSDLFLVDGPPGTGCPLMSTVTGMDAVLVVTEPSVSGLHDLKRVVKVARQFTGRIFMAINRFDLDDSLTRAIEHWCGGEGIMVIGKIPFDPAVIEAVRNCAPVTRLSSFPAAQEIQRLAAILDQEIGVR
jgi:MinD superfamily P-loop ATPase